MSTFTFYSTIPQASDNPSNSQDQILQNFTSIGDTSGSWVTQDHYGFGTGTDGQHLRIRFPAVSTSLTPTNFAAELYTVAGSADTNKSQLVYTNAATTFPVSAVRAFGLCVATGTATLSNSYNITSVSQNAVTKTITVTMPANVVSSANYAVICSASTAPSGSNADQIVTDYAITSSTEFDIHIVNVGTNAVATTSTISFMVLQF